MGDVMDDILKIFFEECDELLPELESGLGELSAEESSQETINAIFRAVHSIKGGAASFGLDRLVRFAHVYESALDGLRSGQVEPDPAIIKTFFLAMDLLSDLVAEAKQAGDEVDGGRIDETVRKLEAIIGQGGMPPLLLTWGKPLFRKILPP
ncbi:Hpt domain-containing protein [Parasaccharibacter sp. TMW 2.1888]|uniref:Hpt domain-containing protein n=1 Tax=Parasaccharibacter sp. TMW 2.1888 TaxID=2268025 RepID=UPI0020BE5D72|nr:Hpt domain-containing protein [Parasaccharibacter sp. TMW 2.1888]